MSISKANSYVTTSGGVFTKLEDARINELADLLAHQTGNTDPQQMTEMATIIVANNDQIVDILTLNPDVPKRGRPRKRKSASPLSTTANAVLQDQDT